MMVDTKKLILRRDEKGAMCLHNPETGRPLSGQVKVEVIQEAKDITRVRVEFFADPRASGGVRIEGDDG